MSDFGSQGGIGKDPIVGPIVGQVPAPVSRPDETTGDTRPPAPTGSIPANPVTPK